MSLAFRLSPCALLPLYDPPVSTPPAPLLHHHAPPPSRHSRRITTPGRILHPPPPIAKVEKLQVKYVMSSIESIGS